MIAPNLCTRCLGIDPDGTPRDGRIVARVFSEEIDMLVCRTCADEAKRLIRTESPTSEGQMCVEKITLDKVVQGC